jgi:hypothetical protein
MANDERGHCAQQRNKKGTVDYQTPMKRGQSSVSIRQGVTWLLAARVYFITRLVIDA